MITQEINREISIPDFNDSIETDSGLTVKVDDKSKKCTSNLLLKVTKLYEIERETKDKPPDITKESRKEKSIPVLIEIRRIRISNEYPEPQF